jgi:hypothetical protein
VRNLILVWDVMQASATVFTWFLMAWLIRIELDWRRKQAQSRRKGEQ